MLREPEQLGRERLLVQRDRAGGPDARRDLDDIFGELSRCVQRELAATRSDESPGAAGRVG